MWALWFSPVKAWGRKGGGLGISSIHGVLHGFHGRTQGTMLASGKPGWDKMFAPQVGRFPEGRDQ